MGQPLQMAAPAPLRTRKEPYVPDTPLPSDPIVLPLLPLRDVVVFPHMVIPLFVGRPKSIKALEGAMEADRQIMLVAQKPPSRRPRRPSDLFDVGCISSILADAEAADGTVKVLVEGVPATRPGRGQRCPRRAFRCHVVPESSRPRDERRIEACAAR